MAAQAEPRNPFYLLLQIVGVAFIVTVLAYAVIPVMEQKAMDAGTEVPPSPFRHALKQDGWKWVLAEVAVLVVLGLASMGLDRWRRWKSERQTSDATKLEPPPPT